MAQITCECISFRYLKSDKLILNKLDLELATSQSVALVGLNGSGKTTFLKLLAGILSPSEGKIFINNLLVKSTKLTKKLVTILPENAKLFLIGPTVLAEFLKIFSTKEKVTQALKSYNLELLINKKIYELSEGERRLIALISALHQDKDIFLLDEPTIGLDSRGREILLTLIEEVKVKNKIIIIATNDNRILPKLDRIVGLKDGMLVIDGKPKDLLTNLQETIGIIPNQIARLIHDLNKNKSDLPVMITANELNSFMNSERK